MTSTKRVLCPHCRAVVIVVPEPWDKVVTCPLCDKRFQVSQERRKP
jgi:uncharacterized Zn-finger protein